MTSIRKKDLLWLGIGVILLFLLSILAIACQGELGPAGSTGPAGPAGPAGTAGIAGTTGPAGTAGLAGTDGVNAAASCSDCHNDTQLIPAKQLQWSQSKHGTGEAYVRGTSASCAGCHAGQGFSDRIAAGLDPDEVEAGVPNPTQQNCRTCHQIHTTFTRADLALESTAPVVLFAQDINGTYDSGDGNLCANCHQPRRTLALYPPTDDGMVNVDSTHWGPHHGMEAAMFIGVGASITGSPSAHYQMAEDGCVTCHLGPNKNHTFEPQLEACQSCHADLDTFDRNGVQTEVEELMAELLELLEVEGILHDGHPVVGDYPTAVAYAAWDYLVVLEDQSMGVHNPGYTKNILKNAIAALK